MFMGICHLLYTQLRLHTSIIQTSEQQHLKRRNRQNSCQPYKMGTTPAKFSFSRCYTFLTLIFVVLTLLEVAHCNPNPPPPSSAQPGTTNKTTSATNSTGAPHKSSAVGGHDSHVQGIYILDPSERFCRNHPKRPFYQRLSDGAVCCRGRQLPVVTVVPETTGECAISTKTDVDGMLDSENLWCAYTCSLKKLGAIDKDGKVVPEVFFNHLSDGLTEASKTRLKTVMTTYLECFKPLKNVASPCHTPLNFQKCFLDAMYYLCSYGMPKADDLAKIKKLALDYSTVAPACYHNRRKASAGCCHGKPMPWTVTEIMEAPNNETKIQECMTNMGPECDATCFLNSVGAVNTEMEMDVGVFQTQVLKHFPSVKASGWMDYLGPVFLFYDEVLADMGDESSDTPHRVCRFHDRVMELHESKVEQYCTMTKEEVKELIKNNPATG